MMHTLANIAKNLVVYLVVLELLADNIELPKE